MKRRLALLIVGAVGVDQFLKYSVGRLPAGSPSTLFAIHPFYNRELAFSVGRLTDAMLWFTILLIITISYLWWRSSDPVLRLGLASLLAGGVSNLIDRLLSGFIIDIVRVSDLYLNLADILIVGGATVAIVRIIYLPHKASPS